MILFCIDEMNVAIPIFYLSGKRNVNRRGIKVQMNLKMMNKKGRKRKR
jgi:hypothetical protein